MSIYYRQIFHMGGVQMATVPTQVRMNISPQKYRYVNAVISLC